MRITIEYYLYQADLIREISEHRKIPMEQAADLYVRQYSSLFHDEWMGSEKHDYNSFRELIICGGLEHGMR